MLVHWRTFVAAAFALAVFLGASGLHVARIATADELVIIVTSSLDSLGEEVPECPSDTLCTLREAILTANADASNEPVRIVFDTTVFAPEEPATIEVVATSLPVLNRDGAVIDASASGVVLTGPTLAGPEANGLAITGAASGVIGLRIVDFAAACIFLEGTGAFAGEPTEAGRNHIDDCAIGVLATGVGATVQGNIVGLEPADPLALVMQSGVVAAASGVVVGGEGSPIPAFNAIGNVTTAVRIGRGAGDPFAGVVVGNNLIGESYERTEAPVGTGIFIDHPSSDTTVGDNAIRSATTGIAVAADIDGLSSQGNTLTGNTFESLDGLAIDLQADGLRIPNDEGDLDTGPNGLLNSPVVTSSTQALLAGTACADCRVTLYVADHTPGGDADFPLEPIIGGDVLANAQGLFSIASPLVSPGDWLMAITTDLDGNTSEFSASVYVGAGTVQCGNVTLQPGWNLVGYFGGTASLDGGIVSEEVLSVHQLTSGGYASWFPNGPSSLTFVQTGEPYWFYSESAVELGGGVSLSTALPVLLSEGWNDFVYIGATVDVADALASLGDSWAALYRFDNPGELPGRWRAYGGPDAPAYAHAFDTMTPCTAFRILMLSDQVFVPLEP